MTDMVNHPPHYNAFPVEVIDIIRATLTPEQFQGYLMGNIIKYRMRAGLKNDLKEDIEKAEWYRNQLSPKTTRLDDGTKIEANKETEQIALRRLRCVNNSIDCSHWNCNTCTEYDVAFEEIYDDIL